MPDQTTAVVIFHALLKLFFISIAGYILVRRGYIKVDTTEGISKFVIYISLPALIISTLGTNLRHELLDDLALCFAAAFLLNILSIALAYFFKRNALPKGKQKKKIFISLSAIQNSGYLPIPLAAAVLPEEMLPLGLLLIFVYIMVMGLIFWSAGIWLITEGDGTDWRESIGNIANPPIITLLLGLLFLWAPVREAFNSMESLRESLDLVGNTTIPLVMFVLGASLGEKKLRKKKGDIIVFVSAMVKLIVIPVCVLPVIAFLPMERTFAFVLILQAAMPAALNHIVIAREYGGDVPLTAGALFVQYLLSLATVPLMLYLFELVY